ncbi:HAD family phosphatase [uncultured Gemmiger sp.]|uniref:HAD family hydrolase n=1 Tax=uncultured Gemmiger sp. TaxID=1623490 RepID=UPI00266659B1|nr:HAD family phosphatase [uncultured Gemmiger sp.]
MIQGVLFDMDGLMFDTERIGRDGWQAAARNLGIAVPESLLVAMRGTGVAQCRALFNAAIPGNLYDTARAQRLQYADAWIEQHGVPVKPGLQALLAWLQTQRIPAVLATSTGREKALGYLRRAGVEQYFAAAVFGPEVAHPKPEPDIFLAAAAAIGAAPEHCVVLEDSPNGLQAAKAARCQAIVVPDLCPVPPRTQHLWDACAADLFQVIDLLQAMQQPDDRPQA